MGECKLPASSFGLRFVDQTFLRWSYSLSSHRFIQWYNQYLMFQMTYAPWPSSPYHDNFYERYISGRSYEPHYTSLLNKTFENTPEEDILLDKETVSQNFLGVQLVIGKQLVMNYEARPQLSLTAFLSQIGGALNLWAGITVVVLVEMLELGYRSLADLLKSKSVDSSSTEMKNHVKASATTQDEDEGYEL